MPVEDKEVAERNKDWGKPYGCHNHPPFKSSYRGRDGYDYYRNGEDGSVVGETKFMDIPHRASTDCMNDTSLSDKKCNGCTHRGQGEQFWAEKAAERSRQEKQVWCTHLRGAWPDGACVDCGLALPTGTPQDQSD